MSREIRRIPIGWAHPSDGQYPNGEIRYIPLMGRSDYDQHLQDTRNNGGSDPNPAAYMPAWPAGTPLGWCLYETVSEGTPVSPVFATEQQFVDWLVFEAGMSLAGAQRLLRTGWAPTGIEVHGRYMPGLQAVNHLAQQVLGRRIRLVDNLGDGENVDGLCGGLLLSPDGSLTIYLDLPVWARTSG